MNINSTTLDRLTGPQISNAPRVGDGSFQAAYARAGGENRAPAAREGVATPAPRGWDSLPPADQATGTVQAGDTLYGIVRARLDKMGVEVTAKAAMQGVKQVAQANNIRNPDRIYVGQKLDLAGLVSTFGPSQTAPLARGVDGFTVTASGIEQPRHLHRENPVTEADPQFAAEAAADLPPMSAETPPNDVAAEVNAALGVTSAARQLAIYEQNAALAPEKPAEPARAVPDILYKGVVGKVLDAMPLEPATRTTLQQTSSIVSGTLTVRSLGALAGFGGPLLTIAGLLWGVFSSRQIEPAAGASKAAGEPKPADAPQPADDAVRTARN